MSKLLLKASVAACVFAGTAAASEVQGPAAPAISLNLAAPQQNSDENRPRVFEQNTPLILLDYRLRASATNYFIDREEIEAVDDVTYSVGSVINVKIGPIFRAYAASSDSLFPDDADFFSNLSVVGEETPQAVKDAQNLSGAIGKAEQFNRVLSFGLRPTVFFGEATPLNAFIPYVTYERRQVTGAFVSERDTQDIDGIIVAPAGQAFNITDEQTIISLQWGSDPRYSAFADYKLLAEGYSERTTDAAFFISLDYIQYDSDLFANQEDGTALITRDDFSSYGLRGGWRPQPKDAGFFFAPGVELGVNGSIFEGDSDRSGVRAGGYLGAFFLSGDTCTYGCVSFSMTLGGFYDESDFTDPDTGTTPLGGNRLEGEFETVFTRWSAEATANLSIYF